MYATNICWTAGLFCLLTILTEMLACHTQITEFWLECDYDNLTVSVTKAGTTTTLWSGGCRRDGAFSLTTGPMIDKITVDFLSDASSKFVGFAMTYEIDDSDLDTNVPCPGSPVCSANGVCSNGACACFSGYVGESCGNVALCPDDLSACQTANCDPICLLDQSSVIAVSMYGDDSRGTGERMTTSPAGKSSKAFQSLRHAIELAQPNQIILLYPGTYQGALNCDIQISTGNITIRGLSGGQKTRIDCLGQYRGFTISGVSVTMIDLVLANMTTPNTLGATINVVDGTVLGTGVELAGGVSAIGGGGMFASRSTVTLENSIVKNCSASRGGAMFLDSSTMILRSSSISQSFAELGGGIFAQNEVHIRGDSASTVELNNATDSGGGVYSNGTLEVDRVGIRQNVAATGAGIATVGTATNITRLTIASNNASKNGGGIAVLQLGVLNLTSSSIRSNNASNAGGGLYTNASARIAFYNHSAIVACTAGEF